MQVAGPIRYQLEHDAQHVILHAYLPEGLTSKDVDISFVTNGSVESGVSIHIERSNSDEELATIPVKNCMLLPDTQAKYFSSKRRLTLRLQSLDAVKPSSSLQSTNSFEFLDSDDVEDSIQQQEGSSVAKKKNKKKKKKKSSSAGAADAQQDVQGDDEDGAEQDDQVQMQLEPAASGNLSPEEADSAAAQDASSKKKKKKKKKSGASSTAAGDDQLDASQAETSLPEAPQQSLEPLAPISKDEEEPEQQDLMNHQQQTAQDDHPQQPAPASPSEPLVKHGSIKFDPASYQDLLAPEPISHSYLGAEVPHRAQQGPVVKHSLANSIYKGEDKVLQMPSSTWQHPDAPAAASFSAWGIFDGHGGKQAATFASKNLLAHVAAMLDRCQGSAPDAQHIEGEEQQDWDVWAAQEALLERMPVAMHAGFVEADKLCKQRHKKSGTTATLAIQCGWELVVANVGDSCAYLDTGAEVLPVSGNHRLDDNQEEQERIRQAGGEIAQATADGEPVGPLRVWPGGLAMSRTIGDLEGGDLVTAEPEVRQVTLPATGARLLIASDGLWDHMNPKTLLHQIRHMPAGAASNTAMYAALKKKGLRDDITVLVIDFMPSEADKYPPALEKGFATATVDHLNVLKPLQGMCSSTWRNHLTQRRAAAVAAERQHEDVEAQAAAAAAAAEAAVAGEDAAAGAAASEPGMSDTYKELAGLRVDTDLLMSLASEPAAAAADDGDWVTVEKKHAGPSFMSELLASATVEKLPEQQQQQGGRRERSDRDRRRRDRDGGRRDRGPRHEGAPSQQQQQQASGQQEGQQQQQQQQQQQGERGPGRERGPRRERAHSDAGTAEASSEAGAGHAGDAAAATGDAGRRRGSRGGAKSRAKREPSAAGAADQQQQGQPQQQQQRAPRPPPAAAPGRVLELPRSSLRGPEPPAAAPAAAAAGGAPPAGGAGQQQRQGPRPPRDYDQRPPRRPAAGDAAAGGGRGQGGRGGGGGGGRGRGSGDRERREGDYRGPRRDYNEGRPRGPRQGGPPAAAPQPAA